MAESARNIVPRLLTVPEAATYLGRTEPALYQLVHRGKLPVVRMDRRVMLDRFDLDRLIEASKVPEEIL